MANLNLIKLKQIDSALEGFIKQVASGEIDEAILQYGLTGYHGANVVYASGGTQSILGQKTFVLSPNVPYSGNDNQAVSKLYISDQIGNLEGSISYFTTGVLHTTGDESAQGIKEFQSLLIEQGITGTSLNFTDQALIPTLTLTNSPDLRSALNLQFFYDQNFLFRTGDQFVDGYKEFRYAPLIINEATGSLQGVRLGQLVDSGAFLQTQINALSRASGNQISGFGGVISLNGQSGNLFILGRGIVTVKQQGNVTLISGSSPVLSGSGVYLLQGEQGLMGQSFSPRGIWETGLTYSYFDIVNWQGNSYFSNTGHMSTINNMPGTGGSLAPWITLLSGGPTGATGAVGATGAWLYKGTYNSGTVYLFNDAATYNGSTYGFSGVFGSGFLSPTGVNWYVIAQSGERGIQGVSGTLGGTGAWQYRGLFNTGTVYNLNNAASFNGSTYGFSGTANSGLLAPTGQGWYVLAASGSTGIIGPVGATGAWLFKGDYKSFVNYGLNNAVTYIGSTYGYTGTSSIGASPETGIGWYLLAKSGAIGATGLTGPTGAWRNRGTFSQFGTYIFNDAVAYRGGTFGLGGNSSVGLSAPTGTDWYVIAASGTVGQTGPTGAWQYIGDYSDTAGYTWNNAVTLSGSSYGYKGDTPISGANPVTGIDWFVIAAKGDQGDIGPTGLSGFRGLPGLAFAWRGNWSSGLAYSSGDAVYYNGSSYGVSVSSSNNIPITGTPWFLLARSGSQGIEGPIGPAGIGALWRGEWDPDVTYSSGDAVFYTTNSYITQVENLGFAPTDGYPWSITTSGSVGETGPIGLQGNDGPTGLTGPTGAWQARGAYNSNITYIYNNAVQYAGSTYGFSGSNSIGILPTTGTDWYLIVASGLIGPTGIQGVQGIQGPQSLTFNWKGTWLSTGNYLSGEAVFYNGSSYGTQLATSGTVPTGTPWFVTAQAGSVTITGGGVRATGIYTTASLASAAYETGNLSLAKSFILQNISTTQPARIRGYSMVSKRDADISRTLETAPTPGNGLLFEFVTVSGALSIATGPMIVGSNNETPVNSFLPLTIENKAGLTTGVSATFSVTVLEN